MVITKLIIPNNVVNQNVSCQLPSCPMSVPIGTPMTFEIVKPAKISAIIGPFLFSGMMSLAMLIDNATNTPLTTAVMTLEKINSS